MEGVVRSAISALPVGSRLIRDQSIANFGADTKSLRPEVRRGIAEDRAGAVQLFRPADLAPIEEVVTRREADVLPRLPSQLEPDLRHHREVIGLVVARGLDH